MKYFITGATGFIGSHLVPKLMAQGHSVTCLVRNPAKAEALKQLGATLVQGDVTDRASMLGPMRGVDGVFHLAGVYEYGAQYRDRMQAINVDGARNVLEVGVELGVPKMVHTSTVAVFGNTHDRIVDETYRVEKHQLSSDYERTKWAAHYEVAVPLIQRGAPIVIVQPGVVTGRGDTSPIRLVFQYYLNRMPVMFGAKSGVTWAHVDDIADGLILAMEKGRIGEAYILAGPALQYRDVFTMWSRITGVRGPLLWMPEGAAGVMSGVVGVLERAFKLKTSLSSEALATFNNYTFYGSADMAKRVLGWQPRPAEEVFEEVLDDKMKE
jgi:nucleoside-diphosphate-sugar epimerase